MTYRVLDPTNETAPPLGQTAPRQASLAGKTIGIVSNGKQGHARLLCPSRSHAA